MKKATARFALATALFSSCVLVGLTPAKATTINWNLSSPGNTDPGNTENFSQTVSSTTYILGAAGFSFPNSLPTTGTFTAINLYNKALTGDENGLGINSDPAGCPSNCNHEIYAKTLVRLDVTSLRGQGINNFQFTIGSTTNGEGMDVYGSSSANTGLALLFSDITSEPGLYDLSGYNYYYFTYDGAKVIAGQGDNVLLASFTGQNTTFGGGQNETPLPAALPLFTSGLGALGLLGWRRKRKNAAALAAA
jgi:hypothetical protein